MSDIGFEEKDFENYIINILTTKSGYIRGNSADYNSQKSLIPVDFIDFVKKTQPDSWTVLCDKFDNEEEVKENLVEELLKQRKALGTLD